MCDQAPSEILEFSGNEQRQEKLESSIPFLVLRDGPQGEG